MLKKIKSSYFLKIIFSNLIEKQKLKIVKYNKNLQIFMDINLMNYRFLSGKYMIYENGNGKEYNGYSDNLLFEGKYLNGKRNGKGKEYKNYGKLIFEGNYLIGKRNGKGKEYGYFGELRFVREYLNGKRMEKEKNMIIMAI